METDQKYPYVVFSEEHVGRRDCPTAEDKCRTEKTLRELVDRIFGRTVAFERPPGKHSLRFV